MLKDNLKNVSNLRRGVLDCLSFSNSPALLEAGRSPGISDADPPISRMDSREGMEFIVKGRVLLPAPLDTRGAQQVSAPCCPYGGQAHS